MLAVDGRGVARIERFVGSFQGEVAWAVFADLDSDPPTHPADTYWQVPVQHDGGDPDVGLAGRGHYLSHREAVQLPWKTEAQRMAELDADDAEFKRQTDAGLW
ncbi:hypothetical protein D3875_04320 [Deinococcus cavernae]|uniref:Uncharacterized protein n=1 Tax=Deinococcus cavernae TaxID=2320857 RepID=A0A418VEI0_9DEIO|nr:hypothetical protein D3875_04320 [Deinococcus cavernae]